MAKLVNANSNQIIFSFMDHIINTRKGCLWDCLPPGQYSGTFYRIWKVNL